MLESQGITEHLLDNGLKVLMKPMRTAPVVSVWIWYGVGSRHERPGITGISHWVEHMLFKGTPGFTKGEIFKSICRVGGANNGFTREDNTVYFETVPAEHLDLGLRIEADRMVNSTFDADEVASERTVIISEREGAENHPQMHLMEAVNGTAYQVHPYRWSVVGHKCDLQVITREDLYEHYRRFYAPDNATLVLVGDLEQENALDLVRRRFGPISPAGRAHDVRSVEPEQCGERRVEVRRPGKAVYWMCACHIPAFAHDDRLPLMVLEAVMSGARPLGWSGGGFLGKSARLHSSLVDRKQVAVHAGGYARLMKDPGLFVLSMMLRDGVKPEKAEAAMFSEIRKLQDKGPKPAELKKAVNQVRAQVEYARDGITANAYTIGNLGSFDALDELETLVDRVAAVSAEDVIRVARTYLQARNRTVGVFIPEGEAETPAGGPSPREAHSWSFPGRWRPLLPADVTPAGEAGNVAWPSLEAPWFAASLGAGTVDLPLIQKRVLDCGTTVFGIESRDSHCVAMAGFLRGGATLDPAGSEGLAYLTAHMLDEGTSRRNCRQIAAVTDKIGASISFGAGADSTDLGGKCLPRGLPKVLALLRECLSDLAAPEPELEKVRQQTVTAMKADRDSTRWLAARAAYEALYPPGHAYHRDHRGTLESIAGIRRETVLEFAAGAFGPQNLTLVLVGPLSFDRMCRQVDNALGSWQPLERVPAFQPLPVEVAASPGERVITVPGKSQCDLVVAQIAVPRSHPDYHALLVASSIFGRFGLMGRIGDRVRDEMGLAYYAYGFLLARTQAGHWEVMAGVNPANVRKALAAITEETRRFCSELVTEQELADTVGNLVGSLALRMETSDSLVYLARDIAFHNLPLDYLERFRAEVQNVTRDKVLALAQRYLADVEPVVVIAGPELPAGA